MSLFSWAQDQTMTRLEKASQKSYVTQSLVFGLRYLRPYSVRFITGIFLGILFGSLNGAFVSATAMLAQRLTATSPAFVTPSLGSDTAAEKKKKEPRQESDFQKKWKEWKTTLSAPFMPMVQAVKEFGGSIKNGFRKFYYSVLDPWLPLRGRTMDWKQITGGLLLLPLLVGLRGALGYASSYCMAWTSQRVVMDLKADVFRKLNELSLDFFNKSTTANLLARINGDTAALNGCLRLGLSDAVKEPITVIGVLTALLLLDWQLTVLALLFVPLMIVPMRIISKKIRKISHSSYELDLKQGSLLMDSFVNIRIVQAFGLQDQQRRDFLDQNRRSMRMGLRTMQAKEILNPIIELFSAIGLATVIVFIFATARDASSFMAFALALGMLFAPIKKLSGIHLYFVQTEVPLKRLMELFSMDPGVKELPNPTPLPAFKQGIRLRDVCFHYNPDRAVLRRVNIDVPRGQKIGLAGDSGSGKSTLINLLFRFYDVTEGAIEMDGVDIRALKLAEMRSHMALVSQDILLFNTTVAENIGFGKIGATREEIIEAARNASAHDFIMAMPEGYDTHIGERGVLISGGQRQRLAIARAFVRNAPILVLDEATASLDSQAEAEVQAAIDRLAEGRTVVCIAHRLSTLSSMDKIYVLRDGEVIEEGGFEELLRRGGVFAGMARRQSIVAGATVAA